MNNDKELKELERKVFTSYFNDGIWDLYGGLIILGLGVGMATGLDYIMLVFASFAVVLLLFKKRIVLPRLGRVEFSLERQAKTKRSIILAFITLTFTMLLGVIFFTLYTTDNVPGWLDAWMHDYFLVAFGGVIAILIVAAAFVLGVRRYYFYAGTTFLGFVFASMLRPNDLEWIPIISASTLILIVGFTMLLRFLRKYPLPPREIGGA